MIPRKPIFRFNRQERRGLLALLFLIFMLQVLYYSLTFRGTNSGVFHPYRPRKPDVLGKVPAESQSDSRFRTDPNHISDFRGYSLGMSTEEIDRLHRYRASGGVINTPRQFREVTGLSDSLFAQLAPKLLFRTESAHRVQPEIETAGSKSDSRSVEIGDLNQVTVEGLQEIRGIGPVLSKRIVKFRELLGGFSVDGQLDEVYGLEPEVARRVRDRYRVLHPPEIRKVDVNIAPVEELAANVYVSFSLARAMVRYREENGRIESFDEISGLKGVTPERIDRIKLYLKL